eukprot:7874419-Lingulodinium_polyedra.AAC.1
MVGVCRLALPSRVFVKTRAAEPRVVDLRFAESLPLPARCRCGAGCDGGKSRRCARRARPGTSWVR